MLWNGSRWSMRGRWELTEEQWKSVEPVLRPRRRADHRGSVGRYSTSVRRMYSQGVVVTMPPAPTSPPTDPNDRARDPLAEQKRPPALPGRQEEFDISGWDFATRADRVGLLDRVRTGLKAAKLGCSLGRAGVKRLRKGPFEGPAIVKASGSAGGCLPNVRVRQTKSAGFDSRPEKADPKELI